MSDTEHSIPLFCPQSLVEYRSMDAPDLIEFLGDQNHLPIEELRIEQGDTSRRLADETLEIFWDRKSQEQSLELPMWTKGDEILQHVIGASCQYRAARLHTANLRTPSSLSAESGGDVISSYNTLTALPSLGSDPGRSIQPPLPDHKSQEIEIERKSMPELPSKRLRRSTRSSTYHRSQRNLRTSEASKPRQTRTLHARERRLRRTTRIQKGTSQSAMPTRSRDISEFYELGLDGVPRSYRTF